MSLVGSTDTNSPYECPIDGQSLKTSELVRY